MFLGILKGDCRPFLVDGKQVGLIRPDVFDQLLQYPEVFLYRESDVDGRVSNRLLHRFVPVQSASLITIKGLIELNPAFRDYNERTQRVEEVLKELKDKDVFVALRGWRNEVSAKLVSAVRKMLHLALFY